MTTYPQPVQLRPDMPPVTLTINDANRLEGLDLFPVNPVNGAPLFVAPASDFAAFLSAWGDGLCDFAPIPMQTGSGGLKIVGGGVSVVALLGAVGASI